MKKVITLSVISAIVLIFWAFKPEAPVQQYQEIKQTGDNHKGIDDPNFAIAKISFLNAYNNYKLIIQDQTRAAIPPVDPYGIFMVDKNGNMSVIPNDDPKPFTAPNPFPPQRDVVSGYTWSQPAGTYTALVGGTTIIGGLVDDGSIANLPIGFTFNYDGTNYTAFGVSYNGAIIMGTALPAGTNYIGLNGTDNNYISIMGEDLMGTATGSIQYLTTGVSPNRILTVQWANYGYFSGPDGSVMNFQIKLFETSNNIQFVWGSCTSSGIAQTPSVGLRGASAADFNCRTTTTNWSATTAGGTIGAQCTYNTGIVPATNLTFQWVPPVASPMAYVSSTNLQIQNGLNIAQSSTNNQIIQTQVVMSGTLSPINLTSMAFNTTGSTAPGTDLVNAKVYYTGTTNVFSTTTQFGSTFASPNGAFTINGSQVLQAGTNYFWLVYDATAGAVVCDLVDAQNTTITGDGTMGLRTPTITAPTGWKQIDNYCRGTVTNSGCTGTGLFISNVTFNTLNSNPDLCDPNANFPYAYNNYCALTTNVEQGVSYTLSVTQGALGNQGGFAAWIDWNNNNTFEASEYYNIGIIPSGGPNLASTTITIPPAAILGNHRMRVRNNFSTVPASGDACTNLTYGETEDFTINVTAATPMVYVSSTATQNNTTGFYAPSVNTEMVALQLVTTGSLSPLSATSFTLNTNGSTNPATDITNAKLWYTGLSSTFATTTQVGATFNSPSGSFVITGSQQLQAGTNYFWLTYDVPGTATALNLCDGEFNSVTVGSPQTPTVQAPAGNRQILGTSLCGTYTIPGSYPTIAAAIADLNAKGINCSVTFNVAAGHTETFPSINSGVINTTGTPTGPMGGDLPPKTITFQKSGAGANPLITAALNGISTTSDGIIKINGGDYITFNGIDLRENPANVTTTTQMEWGYAMNKPTGINGCQNNTIQNCTVTLNKTNTATYGIYLSNVTTTNGAITVTDVLGTNSNNLLQNNTVSNCYVDVYINGFAAASPYTFYDQNNTVTGCNLTNYGGTATTAYGIYNIYQNNLTISNNTINSTGGTNSTGTLYGIFCSTMINSNLTISGNTVTIVSGATTSSIFAINFGNASAGTSNNISVTNNTVQNCTYLTATSGFMYGIYANCGTNNLTLSGNRNIGNTYGGAASTGTAHGMYNLNPCISSITITNNLDSGNVVNGTSSYSLYRIGNTSTTNALTMTGNSVKNNTLCGTSATTTGYAIYNVGGTFSANISNNTVSNNSLPTTSTAQFYCCYSSIASPAYDMNNNTVTGNNGTGTGAFYGVYLTGSPAIGSTVNMNNNTITGLTKTTATGSGAIYGVYHAGSGAGTINMNNNNISTLTSAAASTIYGMYQIGSPPNNLNINNNTINNLSNNGLVAIYGINNFPAGTTISTEYNNTISNLTSPGGTLYGLYLNTSASHTAYKNRIFGITSSTATTGLAYGIFDADNVAGNLYIYNNFISDINAPASTSIAPAVSGIYINSGIATTNVYLHYNTILLKATSSSATTFGTAGIYAITAPNVDLRNNCVVDLSTPGPTGGNACAYRRSTTTLTTYANTSNNNCLYAGTPGANRLIFFDGTNSDQTIAAYRTRVSPRDQVSISENPPFVNPTTTPYDLHIQTSVATGLESGAQVVSSPVSIVNDYDLTARYPNAGYPVGGFTPVAPDIGAHEFGGLNADLVGPSIVYTPLGNGGTTNRSFPNVTITDASGVNTSIGTRPRCYYKKATDGNVWNDNTAFTDGWKYAQSNGTTSPFDFTIDYSLLFGGGGVVAGDVIQYFVIAQDIAGTPNVGWNAATLSGTPTSVDLYTLAPTVTNTNTYTIVANSYSGNYTVGSCFGASFTTLTDVGGLFASINAGVVSGNVTAYICSDITETGLNQLTQWAETGAGNYTLTIVPFDATVKTISGNVAGPLINLNGTDRVLIDGNAGFDNNGSKINLGGRDLPGTKYLTFRNTNGTNPTIQLINDARRNTITNCTIESNNTNTASGTIVIGTTTGANGNDSNTISWCDIRDRSDAAGLPCNGIYSNGTTTTLAQYNNYNIVDNCNIYNYFLDVGAFQAGLYINGGTSDMTITNNSFYQTATRTVTLANTLISIFNNSSLDNNINVTGNYIGGTAPLCGGTAMTYTGTGAYNLYGTYLFVGLLNASSIQGNTIRNINLSTSGSPGSLFKGIFATGLVNVGNITGNTIGATTGNGSITLTTTIANPAINAIDHTGIGIISNNSVGSVTLDMGSATAWAFRCISWANTTAGQTYTCNNNLLGSLTTANSIQQTNLNSGGSIRGILWSNGAGTTNNCTNNTMANLSDFSTSTTLTTSVYGVQNGAAGNYNFSNNTVRNLTNNTNVVISSFLLGGIFSTGTGFNTFSQNTMYSFYANGTGAGAQLIGGILAGGTSGGTVTRNKMYDFRFSGTGFLAPNYPMLMGINCQSSGAYNITNNMIALTNGDPTGDTKYQSMTNTDLRMPELQPMFAQVTRTNTRTDQKPENATDKNVQERERERISKDVAVTPREYDEKTFDLKNLPRIKTITGDASATNDVYLAGVNHTNTTTGTCNYYYNTIYVGGTQPVAGTFNSWVVQRTGSGGISFKNNLFVNARTGGTGNHYVLGNEAVTPAGGWSPTASNYNVLLGSNANTVGEWGAGVTQTIAQFRTSSGGDKQTWSTTTGVISPSNLFTNITGGDLSINTANSESWLVSGKGIALSGQNIDFNGDARVTAITGGVTDIGADEFGAPGVNPPLATESAAPSTGGTTTYTLWGRTLASITWGSGGTSYPTNINVRYWSGVNPPNVLGGNYSKSYTNISAVGNLTGTQYDLTYYFGDNETYTITSPSSNTLLAKYDGTWEVFPFGTGAWNTQLTYNTGTSTYSALVTFIDRFSDFALTDVTSALPVVLSEFTATVNRRDVNLRWVTTNEINNAGFMVQRRIKAEEKENTNWVDVKFINGHGTTNEQQTYTYTDAKLNSGKYEYRLKQQDFNGHNEMYNLADLVTVGTPVAFDMGQNYPNPSNPKSKIDYAVPFTGKVTMKIYDVIGKEIATIVDKQLEAGYYTAEFDGTNLASGIYFYRITAEGNGQNFNKTLKMVLVK